MSRAVELSLTPAIMGFLGSLLDRWLGTWPVFAITLFVLTLRLRDLEDVHAVQRGHGAHEAELPSRRASRTRPGGHTMTATAAPAGPAVERDLAFHMITRAVPLAPLIVLGALIIRGGDGAWSALLAVGIVVVNLVFAAALYTWGARTSANMLMVAALGGFLLRMLLVTLVVVLVKDQSWVDLPTLAVALLVTQLGLLAWECHHVATSLAVSIADPVPDPVPGNKETFAQ